MGSDPRTIGIDFGTTNSRMAWYDPDIGRAEIIRNAEGEDKTPSLVYFGEEETLVGRPVEDLLEEAEDYDDPVEREDVNQRVVKSIKRNLISPPVIPIPGREPVRPVEVVAEILGKLKRDAEHEHFQEEVERVVITCPAVFSPQEWEVVLEAAKKAGFERIERLEEPTAAALAVARLGQRVGMNILVYDLGAGTFDLSVIAREEEDGSFYVPMEPQGDPRCGGDDLDLALYNHCDKLAQEQLGRPISLTGGIDLAFLRQCRSRKQNLSVSSKSRFSSFLSSNNGSQRFRYEVDRETFEGLVRPLIEDTAKKTAAMVERAKDQEHEVDTVVLIGGSTRVPLVGRLLSETLPIVPRNFAEKDYAVALGAAYRTYELWDEELGPKAEEYRRTLDVCWSDRRLTRSEAGLLADLVRELELSQDVTARVEREVMGDTLERVLEHQLREAEEEYHRILELIWKDGSLKALQSVSPARLDVLLESRDLFCGLDFDNFPLSTEERMELLGDMPWATFAMAARVAVDSELSPAEAQERLRALADDLSLSKEQAVGVEREVLGSTIEKFLEGPRREAAGDQELDKGEELAREQGRVKWFDAKKGYGFLVRPTGEDLFVHHSEVQGDGSSLTPNEEVEYEVGRNDRGLNARGVRLVEQREGHSKEAKPPASSRSSTTKREVAEQQESTSQQESERSRGHGFLSVRSEYSRGMRLTGFSKLFGLYEYEVMVNDLRVGTFKEPTTFRVPVGRCSVRIGFTAPSMSYKSNVLNVEIEKNETKRLVCSVSSDFPATTYTLRIRLE